MSNDVNASDASLSDVESAGEARDEAGFPAGDASNEPTTSDADLADTTIDASTHEAAVSAGPCPATQARAPSGACTCPSNSYAKLESSDGQALDPWTLGPDGVNVPQVGATCACFPSTNATCPDVDAGAACVDTTSDPGNCGGCGRACPSGAVCNAGQCSTAPAVIVPPAPGCVSIQIAYDSGTIYWADLGHGIIGSVPAAGGTPTTVASGLHLAALQSPFDTCDGQYEALQFPGNLARETSIVARSGTVYFIASDTEVSLVQPNPLPSGYCPKLTCQGANCCDPAHPDPQNCVWKGAVGTSLWSVTPPAAPVMVLSGDLVPAASPAALDAGIETSGSAPPILSLALSPDGHVLYFGAGTRVYAIPSTGAQTAADVRYVGFVSPLGEPTTEGGWVSALAADNTYAYVQSGWWDDSPIEFLASPDACAPDAGDECKELGYIIGGSDPDTLEVRNGTLYWANDVNASVDYCTPSAGDCAGTGTAFTGTINGGDVTGFAVGNVNPYFGEDGYVERGVPEANLASSVLLARDQPLPTSFALDGTHVVWTTSRCDILSLADTPQ